MKRFGYNLGFPALDIAPQNCFAASGFVCLALLLPPGSGGNFAPLTVFGKSLTTHTWPFLASSSTYAQEWRELYMERHNEVQLQQVLLLSLWKSAQGLNQLRLGTIEDLSAMRFGFEDVKRFS